MPGIRAALYARVSKKDQFAENQLYELREYCKAKGWTIQKEFVDTGSGADDDRPALNKMMEFVRQRRADIFLVWKFDRFARDMKHLVDTLAELDDLGVHFASFTETLDTTTAQGRLHFHSLGMIAQFERDILIERIHAGLRRARRLGRFPGRKPKVFDREKASQLRVQGLSLREIRAQTGVPIATLCRLFQKRLAVLESLPVGEVIKN